MEEEEPCLALDDDEEELGRPVIGSMGVGSMGLGRSFGSVGGDDRETALLGLTGTLGARLMTEGEPLGFMPVELMAGEDWV